MDYTPLRFIGEEIQVGFEKPPTLDKFPPCPNTFTWEGEVYRIVGLLKEWRDYSRRGRMTRNMQPHNAAKALRRGSWGVGRFYFRVQVDNGQVFDLYYDRAPKSAAERKGGWFLYRELKPD